MPETLNSTQILSEQVAVHTPDLAELNSNLAAAEEGLEKVAKLRAEALGLVYVPEGTIDDRGFFHPANPDETTYFEYSYPRRGKHGEQIGSLPGPGNRTVGCDGYTRDKARVFRLLDEYYGSPQYQTWAAALRALASRAVSGTAEKP